MSKATKAGKATIGKNASGYGYRYADMAKVHEYIAGINGNYYHYTKTDEIDHKTYVWTHRFADDVLDHEVDIRGSEVVAATLSNGKQNPAQAHGSALTYARRYSLYMAYGLAVDDNDAEDLTIPDEYEQPTMTYRQRLIEFANANNIALEDVATQYDLVPKDTEEHYKQALEALSKDLEG